MGFEPATLGAWEAARRFFAVVGIVSRRLECAPNFSPWVKSSQIRADGIFNFAETMGI